MVMRRGDIWWAELPSPLGSEAGHTRPVLVVQDDFLNSSRIGTTVIVPLTSIMRYAHLQRHVLLPRKDTLLDEDSLAVKSQIMTVNVRDKSARIITNDGRNGDPSWAPDSRHVVLTSNRSGTRQLWIVDVESGRARQLTRGASARLSAWSPRLAAP